MVRCPDCHRDDYIRASEVRCRGCWFVYCLIAMGDLFGADIGGRMTHTAFGTTYSTHMPRPRVVAPPSAWR